MIVELYQINSLSEIDFDSLFADSIERMDKNFLWPEVIKNNFELKKKVYRDQLITAINGKWQLKNETDTFIMIATKVNGVIVEFAAGYKEAEGYLALRWNLISSAGGDGSWRYTPEAHAARIQFMSDNGIIGIKEYTFVGSLLYLMRKQRLSTGNYTLEENPIIRDPDPYPGYQFVELITRFN